MNQFKHAKWWRSYLDKLWQSFWKLKFMKNQALEVHSPLPKSFKVCKERTMEKRKTEWRKQRTAATVFLRTFGALPEVHFLHAIYHFKAQEVNNPMLQTVYNLELKWGRYGLWKTTASGLCEIRTTPWNSHNTFSLCEACAKLAQHLPNSHSPCVVRIFLCFCRLHFRSFLMYFLM